MLGFCRRWFDLFAISQSGLQSRLKGASSSSVS